MVFLAKLCKGFHLRLSQNLTTKWPGIEDCSFSRAERNHKTKALAGTGRMLPAALSPTPSIQTLAHSPQPQRLKCGCRTRLRLRLRILAGMVVTGVLMVAQALPHPVHLAVVEECPIKVKEAPTALAGGRMAVSPPSLKGAQATLAITRTAVVF
jgi:hypothetical protein